MPKQQLYKIYKVVCRKDYLYFVEYWGDTTAIFPEDIHKKYCLEKNLPHDWEVVFGILIRDGITGYLYIPTEENKTSNYGG